MFSLAVAAVVMGLGPTPPSPGQAPGGPLPLWVVNVTGLPARMVPLFQAAQGVVNRGTQDRVMLVGLVADSVHSSAGADAAVWGLDFLRGQYADRLAYSESRVLAGAGAWRLFALRDAPTHVVWCGSADTPLALYVIVQ